MACVTGAAAPKSGIEGQASRLCEAQDDAVGAADPCAGAVVAALRKHGCDGLVGSVAVTGVLSLGVFESNGPARSAHRAVRWSAPGLLLLRGMCGRGGRAQSCYSSQGVLWGGMSYKVRFARFAGFFITGLGRGPPRSGETPEIRHYTRNPPRTYILGWAARRAQT